jgi:GNAT superfamily N-acetyltransferase
MTISISPAEIEQIEAESYADFEAAASAAARAALGTRELRVAGGVALAMPNDSSRFWSKALGLGFSEPVTVKVMERIAEFYRRQGLPSALVQIAPHVLPPDWAEICEKVNIADSGSAWVKLLGELSTMSEMVAARGGTGTYLDAGLSVATVSAERAREWASVMWEVFEFPVEYQIEMPVAVVGRPGWQAFGVFEDDAVIAVGALHMQGRVGHLFGGATLPRARGRGAQSALIAARVLAAREAGCDWLVAETFGESPGEHSPSLHNMLRAGMSVRYERQNWVWRARAEQSR